MQPLNILDNLFAKAEVSFSKLSDRGIISGSFRDDSWSYRGHRLLFSEIGQGRQLTRTKSSLTEIAGKIARCYMIKNILDHCSPSLAICQLNSFRWLARTIGTNDRQWMEFSRATLNSTVLKIKAENSPATTYHRACSLNNFVNYLNNLTYSTNGQDYRFVNKIIHWKHGIENPIRSTLDITSSEHKTKREKLYEENIHLAISKARSLLRKNPGLEPAPGYDRIRLESLCFAMAQGLRIGEVCSLPKRAVTKNEETGLYYSLVATEKGALPSATALADIWVEPINEAFAYLLDACDGPRARAREIEVSGFAFVKRMLSSYRNNNPLTINRVAQLDAAELSHSEHFFIDELVATFSVSAKELSSGGRRYSCAVPLPREGAAKLIGWLDKRFKEWDWTAYSKYFGGYKLLWGDISKYSGASRSSINKADWFIADLRKLLDAMTEGNIFDPAHIGADRSKWCCRWEEVKRIALQNTGGKSCVAINIDTLTEQLKTRYAGFLSAHFKEEFDGEGNKSSKGYQGNNVRVGMEKKLSEHLIVVWENHFSGGAELGIIPRPILRADYYNYLCDKGQKITAFKRLGVLDELGEAYSFSPHAIRRWVTTAILRSGPSETAVDLWMGRSPRQTRHYDYRTAKERAEYARSKYMRINDLPKDFLGRSVVRWRESEMEESQIELLITEKLRALHYTPWGTCSRELYISPCDKGLMCVRGYGTSNACASFQIDRDDDEAKGAIIKLRSKYALMLNALDANYENLSRNILAELNDAEPLDQHIAFAADIVQSCDTILAEYMDRP